MEAVSGGHIDVVDLLVSEFGARVDVRYLMQNNAAQWGQDLMIDHLVERYGLDPNAVDGCEQNTLHRAAESGRVRTVQHLIEKHNVDIHVRDCDGKTALDLAEKHDRTECASFLRELGATNGEPSETESSSDEDLDSDDGSGGDSSWDDSSDDDAM